MRDALKIVILLLLLLLLATGCTHREVRVDCDGPLRPINLPAPKVAATPPGLDHATASP
jgi:hypothetical protein